MDKEKVKRWRSELELEIKNLRDEYDQYESDIGFLNDKINIASRASAKVGFGKREGFIGEILNPLESKLDSLEAEFEEYKDSSNERLRYVNALIDEINLVIPKEEV